MARPKEKEREQIYSSTRQRLLEAAAEEFSCQGYVGANINRISMSAGYAKGTIYNYFDSKEALMLALIDHVASAHFQYITERILTADNPILRLERFFEVGFGFVSDYLPQALVMVNTLYGPNELFRERMWKAYQPLFEFVAVEIIANGADAGVFRQVNPAETALMIMTIYLGTGSQVNRSGRHFVNPSQVADFVRQALKAG